MLRATRLPAGVPQPGRSPIFHRAVHRENLQRQAPAFGSRLPAASRVRAFASDFSSFIRPTAGDCMTVNRKMRAPSGSVFEAWRNLSVRCVITSFYPRTLSRFPVGRVPGYRSCRKEHALPIVRDEFRPAIPRRGARQRCPSPLHRHHQSKTIALRKGMIYHRTVPIS